MQPFGNAYKSYWSVNALKNVPSDQSIYKKHAKKDIWINGIVSSLLRILKELFLFFALHDKNDGKINF